MESAYVQKNYGEDQVREEQIKVSRSWFTKRSGFGMTVLENSIYITGGN